MPPTVQFRGSAERRVLLETHRKERRRDVNQRTSGGAEPDEAGERRPDRTPWQCGGRGDLRRVNFTEARYLTRKVCPVRVWKQAKSLFLRSNRRGKA